MAKLNDEKSRIYWEQKRHEFIAKNDRLFEEPDYFYISPVGFYTSLFPEGFMEDPGVMIDWDEPGGGKPNAIVLEITHEVHLVDNGHGRKVEKPVTHRYTLTDAIHGDDSEIEDNPITKLVNRSNDANTTMFVSPVTYFGKQRSAKNARFLHAFTVDLDGVGVQELKNLLKQVRNGRSAEPRARFASLPQPSAIVNSGTGLHLYYFLDTPVPLKPGIVPFLQELKRALTNIVWIDSTSTLGERQYQGIYQGFRMVGTTTKLNGVLEDSKLKDKYEVTAFMYEPDGEPWTVSLDYLVAYTGVRGDKETMKELEYIREHGVQTPLATAQKLWPDWYQRIVIEGQEKGRWECSRSVYDWWLGKIRAEASIHHRYWCVQSLAAYADKAGVPYEELEEDAFSLVDIFDRLTDSPDNHFTEADVLAALDSYGDGRSHRYSIDGISRRTAIDIEKNKRNGRSQEQHLKIARFARDLNYGDGKRWDDGNGRKPKADMVRSYAADHPDKNHSEIARELGVSRPTVIKWLKEQE